MFCLINRNYVFDILFALHSDKVDWIAAIRALKLRIIRRDSSQWGADGILEFQRLFGLILHWRRIDSLCRVKKIN